MPFKGDCMAFILLSICRYAFLNVNKNFSTNEENLESVGCTWETWPSNSKFCKSSLAHVPYCYCDEACHEYRDCCRWHDVSLSNKHKKHRSNSETDKFFRSRICMRKLIDAPGFWMVNSCKRTGLVYSNLTTFWNSFNNLNDPPVTDNNNVTYINADCARCNNVTVFKIWDVLFTEHLFSFKGLEPETTFTESVFAKNIKKMLPRVGFKNLVPPSDISLRVCYGQISDYENCSTYQNPVFSETDRSHAQVTVYKDEECCRSSGIDQCSPVWDKKNFCNDISGITFRDGNMANGSLANTSDTTLLTGKTKGFAILLQFGKHIEKDLIVQNCVTDQKEICRSSTPDSLKMNILVSGYPLRQRLILISYKPFDKGLSPVLFHTIATFLSETKWKISYRDDMDIAFMTSEESHCTEATEHCTILYIESFMYPHMMLTVSDTILLEEWMKTIKMDIYMKSPATSYHFSGSFSIQPLSSLICGCNNTLFKRIRGKFTHDLKRIPISSKKIPNHCENFTLTLNIDKTREDLKISCTLNDLNNRSGNKNKNNASIYALLLLLMLCYSLFL